MISIFPLWTFHLYVATFQQHLHMEYIYLSWYDIPELVVPIRISFIEDCCLQVSYCTTNDHGYVTLVLSTSRSFPHSWPITGFATIFTRRVPLVEQEQLTLPEHLSSPPVFSGVRVTRSLVLCVCFVDRCLSFCTFSFGHCVVCYASIYRFWLPLWYLQTLLLYHWVLNFSAHTHIRNFS